MGLFSFLKSKGDESAPAPAPAAVRPDTAAPAVVDVPAAELAAEAAAAESGLNVEALVAPPVAPAADAPTVGPVDAAVLAELQPKIVDVLKTVYDPEIPVDIYELGLIYDIAADTERRVLVKMTLTSPACPSAQQLPSEVRYKVKDVPGVSNAWVEIVWEPPWDKDRMSEAARLQLGFF